MAVLVGRTLGEFVVGDRLGAGGFAEVYRAVQRGLGREVVVKVLRERHADDPEGRRRFLHEAQLASRLASPHVAHVYAYGVEPDGTAWLAMELVHGTPLSTLLAERGPWPLDRFVAFFELVCAAVSDAHEQGIVHRDLKPANVMVTARGGRLVPKLLDFGMARIAAAPEARDSQGEPGDDPRLTQPGVRLGTPLYMAPEQWRAGDVDAGTDIYALGILAYECLVGRPPFGGKTFVDVGRQHLDDPLPPLPPDLPAAVHAVLARAAAKRPEQRFASAPELAAALRAAAGADDRPQYEPPRLDDAVRRILVDAPQPIAEAAQAFDSSRNVHQAVSSLRRLSQVLLRYLSVLALAGRTRAGERLSDSGSRAAADGLRLLYQRDLTDAEWADLTVALVAPARDAAELHPVPELVRAVTAGVPAHLASAATLDDAGAEVEVAARLAAALGGFQERAELLAFIAHYPLVVGRAEQGVADRWMGSRRLARALVPVVAGVELAAGRPFLLDADGRPTLSLWPLVQVGAPSPGIPDELFLLSGRGSRGARLVAAPLGFERQDEAVWEWLRSSLLDVPSDAGPEADTGSPYRGLESFTREHAATFVGRERQVEAFVNRLRLQPLLVVAGPSGAGKSSFVQAGVLPALPAEWQPVVLRPGPTPLATLELRLGAAPPAASLVVVVDQLEELFTLGVAPDEQVRFAARLAELAGASRVILIVRDDFLASAENLPPLRHRLGLGLELCTTPQRADLVRVLVEPARRAGHEFDDPQLPDRMVDEVVGEPGALPLLSFAAARLWEARDRHFRRLTAAAYEAMGGVAGALARHAEATLDRLPASERQLVRAAFRHLVTASGTRARPALRSLVTALGGGPATERVLDRLVAARLLTVSDEGSIEIVHEALLERWPRLAAWHREDREGAQFHEQLAGAARAWDERGRPRGLLWRGDALVDYERWRRRTERELLPLEAEFAAASQREASRARRVQRGLVAGAFVALSVAVALLIVFSRRASDSAAAAQASLIQSYEEQGRQLFLAGDSARAAPYLAEAMRLAGSDRPEARYLLQRALPDLRARVRELEVDAPVTSLDVAAGCLAIGTMEGHVVGYRMSEGKRVDLASHQGRVTTVSCVGGDRVLSTGWDGVARVSDAPSGKPLVVVRHGDRVYSARPSPDGTRFATASWDGTARVWSTADGTLLHTLPHGGKVELVAWTSDGARLLTANREGLVALWDAASGTRIRAFQREGRPFALEVSRDGALALVAGTTNQAEVWDLVTGELRAALAHPRALWDAALSPDGGWAATGAGDGSARLWNAATGRLLAALPGEGPAVTKVRFCGPTIVSGAFDGSVRLWEAPSGRLRARLDSHQHIVSAVACDGEDIVTGSHDRFVRIWRQPTPQIIASAAAGSGGLTLVHVSSDGKRAAAVGQDSRTSLWELPSLRPLGSLPTEPDQVTTAFFDPAGERLLLAGVGNVVVWHVARRERVLTVPAHEGSVGDAEWSPDGRGFVTAGDDGFVAVWDDDGNPRQRIRAGQGPIRTGSFHPRGDRFVTAGADGSAKVWDVASGALVLAIPAHPLGLDSAFYDRAGARIVTASDDRTARIFDAETGRLLVSLPANQAPLSSAVFSPDGERVAIADQSDVVSIWDARTGRLLQTLRGHEGHVSNPVFMPDGSRLVTAGRDDDRLFVWDVSVDQRPLPVILEEVRCRSPYSLLQGGLVRVSRNDNCD